MASVAEPPVSTTYPSSWEADVVLRDGATAHLRPIRPDDADALQRFHQAQSPESIYLRFFAPMPRLSERDLHRFTHVDHRDRVALVLTVGGQIIGIGRYDRVAPAEAEVAFNIADAQQGRGVGSVLLEHLAAAARENGVHRFQAEVLPQNGKMLGVFRDAGYEVRHRYEDGVISLGFDIDPTDRSTAVLEAREHRAEARSVHTLLNPASLVLIGASRREGTIGHALATELVQSGFTGALHVVHPEADVVLGLPTHRSLADLPGPVDLAIIAVPASAVLDVVGDCARAGVRGLVVVSGGFAETGPVGRERQRELVRVARANGMRVVGPNSWGVINADPQVALNVTLHGVPPTPGRLGLFCQSGALSVTVLDLAIRRGVGISTFLSAGNRADVSGNDCLQYWEADPRTEAIGLYLESMGNPRKFSRIARRLSRTKPVIVVTSGTSGFGMPPGQVVAAGRAPREAFDAMLRQSGCLRVHDVHPLVDVAQLVLHQPLPLGDRVAVVANSDALGALIADACLARGLMVIHGPAVVPVLATAEEFRTALEAAFGDPQVDAVIAAFVPPLAAHSADVARCLAQTAARARQPVVACMLGMHDLDQEQVSDQLVGHLGNPPDPAAEADQARRRVPTFATPEEAVAALSTVVQYGQWRRRDPGTRVDPSGRDRAGAERFVHQVLARHPDGIELDAQQSAELLGCYGIDVWPAFVVHGPDDAAAAADRVGWPVALKTTAAHLRHRVDLGGVRLDIADADELAADLAQMRERLTPLGGTELVVQRMAPAGVACVVRSVEDPLFGPVVSFGLGGDASDLLGDVGHRIAPLTDVDVAELVRSVRAAPKLFGHRGARPVDTDALHDVIARVATMADELPELASVELNPVVVADTGACVLGAMVRVAPVPVRIDAVRRELGEAE